MQQLLFLICQTLRNKGDCSTATGALLGFASFLSAWATAIPFLGIKRGINPLASNLNLKNLDAIKLKILRAKPIFHHQNRFSA